MTQSKHNRFTTSAKTTPHPTTAVILSAAPGRRMIGHGVRSLLPFQNKLVIDYQINSIRAVYPECEIVVVSGFQHEHLYQYLYHDPKTTILYNPIYKDSLNTLSLYMALLTITNHNVLFMNGDIVCSPSAIPTGHDNMFTVDTRGRMKEDEIGINIYKDTVVNLGFGLPTKWGQIGYIKAEDVMYLTSLCANYDQPLFSCLNTFCSNAFVTHHEHQKSILFEIDSIKDLP